MRLRSIIFLAIFFFLSCSLIGQDEEKPEFFVGPELEEQRVNRIWQTFGHSEDFFFCIRSDRRKKGQFTIEKIDIDSLQVLKTTQFTPSEIKGKLPALAYPLSTNKGSFLIATAEDPTSSDIYIMAYPIPDDLQIGTKPIIIGIADRDALIAENGFLIIQSEDAKKLVLFIPKEKDVSRNEKFDLRYFDSRLNLLESKQIEIPYPSARVQLKDAVLTPNGIFHGIISLSSESEVRVLPDSYALLSYNPAEDGVLEKALSLGNKWFYDLKLTVTPDTNLWLAGYYSNMVEPSMVGTFSVVIDSDNGDLLNTGLSSFDRDFRLMFRQDLKSKEDDLSLFHLDEVFLKSSESLSLVSEKRYSRESTIYNPSSRMYTVIQVNYYEELLVTTIKPSSKIMENILIPKYQSSSRESGRYSSYVKTQWGDKLLFFYNEHARNESLSPLQYGDYRSLSNENNMVISYCVVKDGKIDKKTLDPDLVGEYYLDAEHSYRTSKSQILTTYRGYRTKYVKVGIP